MRRGLALTDEDRHPWLAELGDLIASLLARGRCAVLACSALRQSYRDALVPPGTPDGAIAFVYLQVGEGLLEDRLLARAGHFAGVELLESQLHTLEEPADALWIDGSAPPSDIVQRVRDALAV
ncbi:MAG: gluconokinase [Gemmatimonadota bacterium]|nr:gluconokinase [Gemmatimonadota bacterium]